MEFNGFELEVLELRGLENTYYKTNLNDKYEVYYDELKNNYLVFTPYDDCDTESIVNGIGSGAYEYLIDTLNTNQNVVVEWSQVEGTTSDYTIWHGIEIDKETGKSHIKINEFLSNIKVDRKYRGYKYTEIINGVQNLVNA